MKTEKKPKEAKRRASDEKGSPSGDARKRPEYSPPVAAAHRPPPVLRETKNTAGALGLLEKAIKCLHQKELKKARHELETLVREFPGETEIVARARTYLQICSREDAASRKPAVTNDQLYTLGVMDHNQENYDGAVAYFRRSLENHPSADYVYYSMAASLAMKGDAAPAIESLRRAIELNEDNRVYAKNDSDFSSLHGNKEFATLVGFSQSGSR